LRNPRVRRSISRQAYYDKAFVTTDAELCAALHLQCPQWKEALIAFTKSGGYNFLSPHIAEITVPTLVVWGRQDRILGVKDAARFQAEIPHSKLVWIDQCGHVPHLEQAAETAAAIAAFIS
jgi:pimeloyl-ACP methyl ester carboxylesterase